MKKNKKKKGTGKAKLLINALLTGIVITLAVTLAQDLVTLSRLNNQLAAITEKNQQQADKNSSLEALLESGDIYAIIERIARERRGYARPGEVIYEDVTGG